MPRSVADRVLIAEKRKLAKMVPAIAEQLGLTPGPDPDTYFGYSARYGCPFDFHAHPEAEKKGSHHFNPWLHCCLNRDHSQPKPDGWIGKYDDLYHDLGGARFTGKHNCNCFERATAKQIAAQWVQHTLHLYYHRGEFDERYAKFLEIMDALGITQADLAQ